MTIPIASTRMYNVAPGATAAWRRLLDAVQQRSGVAMRIVDHPHPATLASLWQDPALGCAFMCGWPLAQENGRRPVIAAPVPAGSAAPRYHAVFVVAAASDYHRLEQTFGHSFAYNAKGSHSGWNMPQAHLSRIGGWYAAEIGPFGPHQNAAAAVAEGQASVAAIDSLVWALLCRHDPALARRLRVVGRTDDQPSPPLVAADGMDQGSLLALRTAVLELSGDEPGRALLADACLAGFCPATLADYAETLAVGQPELI